MNSGRQLGRRQRRVDEVVQRDVVLVGRCQHEVDELFRSIGVGRIRQDAGELDLLVAAVQDRRGRGRIRRRIGEDHLGCRAARVGDHDGTLALAGAAREGPVVGLAPTVDDLDAVVAKSGPELHRAVLPEPVDRGQQERQSRRGRGGVLDDELVAVRLVGEVLQRLRRLSARVGVELQVDVEADLAGVDRSDAPIEAQLVGDLLQSGGFVGHEQVAVEGAGEQRAVHAEQDVGLGVIAREQRTVDHLAGIGPAQDLDVQPRLGLERRQRGLRNGIGVVGEQSDGTRLLLSGVVGAACCQKQQAAEQRRGRGTNAHDLPPLVLPRSGRGSAARGTARSTASALSARRSRAPRGAASSMPQRATLPTGSRGMGAAWQLCVTTRAVTCGCPPGPVPKPTEPTQRGALVCRFRDTDARASAPACRAATPRDLRPSPRVPRPRRRLRRPARYRRRGPRRPGSPWPVGRRLRSAPAAEAAARRRSGRTR